MAAITPSYSPLAVLGSKGMVNLMFPLEDQPTYHTHHIKFTVYQTKRETRNSDDKTKAIATITLPLTQELQVNYNAGYASPDLGATGALALSSLENLAASTSGKGFDVGAIVSSVTKSFGQAALQAPAIVGTAALEVMAKGGGTAQGGLAGVQAFGVARNPHKATLFEGTDFRSPSFSFRFSPVRASESDAIRNIIHIFKYHMHPGYVTGTLAGAGNHFFTTPEFFKIELSNKGKYTVNDYRICVLKGMTVNYQPSNYPAYARAAGSYPAPMEVIMNLEFQETEIITKEVIGNPYTQDPKSKTEMPKTKDFITNNAGAATGISYTTAGLEKRVAAGGTSGRAAARQLAELGG